MPALITPQLLLQHFPSSVQSSPIAWHSHIDAAHLPKQSSSVTQGAPGGPPLHPGIDAKLWFPNAFCAVSVITTGVR